MAVLILEKIKVSVLVNIRICHPFVANVQNIYDFLFGLFLQWKYLICVYSHQIMQMIYVEPEYTQTE